MLTVDKRSRLTDWFLQWRLPLRKFLVRRGTLRAADLEDVAQEVFLRLMRYDSEDLIEHPQAYVYKVAANVAAEWSIRSRNARPHEPSWLSDLLADDRPDENVARDLAQLEVERALNTLSGRHRAVLKLHFAENLSHVQIAERMSISLRIVRRLMIESYQQLRTQLSPELLDEVSHGRE